MSSSLPFPPRAVAREGVMNAAHSAYQAISTAECDREQLLVEELPQVRFIARRIHERLPQHVQLEDLVNAGVLGLIDALHKYDGSKNVQFKSYAKFRIQGAILDSLRELDWSPRDLRRKGRQVEQAHLKLSAALQRVPTEDELAVELGMSLAEFQSLLTELSGLELGNLTVEQSDDGAVTEVSANLPASDEEGDPFKTCLRGEMKQLLARCISELPERERMVLTLYYYEELTMKEVGAVLGVVESRVSQIRSAALARLRGRMAQMLKNPGETGGNAR